MTELIEFLDAHGQTLFRLLFRLTMRADVSDDLMQELFLRLSASQSFRTSKRPVGFAHRVAIHLALDWRRSQSRSRVVALTECDPVDDLPSPLESLVEREQLEKVLNAVATLSPRNRELITLHYIQQQPYQTLAEEYNKSPHQVRALCHKALARLREEVMQSSRDSSSGGET